MARERHVYRCQECGAESPRWMGRCPGCGRFNTMVEELSGESRRVRNADPTWAPLDVEDTAVVRLPTGLAEVDRVLGGGIVAGSLVLLGGDPGIGKSTLMLQVAAQVSAAGPVLYVSAEESRAQVRLRAERLGARGEALYVLADGRVDRVEAALLDRPWRLAVLDSLQTAWDPALESAPGSVSQVREVAARIMRVAKSAGIPVFLIGHVNKEGALAGPRVVEHLVDVVLMVEGDRQHLFRVLRGVKNRFGPTQEVALFAMERDGLVPVPDPSVVLLRDRPADAPGSAVAAVLQGSRPMLVEVQALVTRTAQVPRRVVFGLPVQRLLLLLAILERHAGLRFGDRDVFVKLAGGIAVDDPAMDLALAASVISSLRSRVVPSDAVLIGEIGLTGHVQGAPQMAARIREARQLGFETVVAPAVKGEADPAVRPIARVAELEERLGWPWRPSALEKVEDA